MIERVVVGWDGSMASAEAADWAARRQKGAGALELVRVLDDTTIPPDWESSGGTVAGTRKVLDEETGRLKEAYPSLEIVSRVVVGPRESELERLAERDTLLVLGTQERLGPRMRFRFSLAVRLAARARGPVAVVPQGAQAPADGPVVAGVDGSDSSIEAALLAAGEAVARGVGLVVVHAWWESSDWDVAVPFEAGVFEMFESAHRRVLEECVQPVERRHPSLAVERRLVHAPRTETLLAAAEGASCLVVGKHARAVARGMLLGSVSRNILLDVWTPTLVAGLPTRGEKNSGVEPAADHVAI
jgi:nucleotide-binding universal stress UspA family protein